LASLGMYGPYDLTADAIHKSVKAHVPGVYAVGYTRESGAFVVRYIGRSDSDMRGDLEKLEHDETARFKWAETATKMEAFDTQCVLYHKFGGDAALENEDHPEPPKNSRWVCPVCDILGR
jgi:hypothetical protein